MRHIIIFSLLLFAQHVFAQEEKLRVAVFDPTSSGTTIDEGSKVAVRELVSSTFVNTGKYNIVERSLLERVMKEQEFSNSGVVDDSQATEIGKLAGAHKVVLSVVTLVGGRNMLSIKVIDVKTATIDQQKTRLVQTNDLLDAVEPLTLELLGVAVAVQPATTLLPKTVEEKAAPGKDVEETGTGSTRSSAAGVMSGEEKMAVYTDAQMFCKQSSKDGFHDWRLPTHAELLSIYKSDFSLTTRIPWYWTSTCLDEKCKTLRVLNMTNGRNGTAPQRKEIMILCVR
jgi:hypothetical protein